jgi:hypothetical protein
MKVKVKEILEAAKENGYEHYQSGWGRGLGTAKNPYTAGCILTQTAINLGVDERDLFRRLGELREDGNNIFVSGIGGKIVNANDAEKLPYKKLVSLMNKLLKPHKDAELNIKKKKHYAIRKDGSTFVK